MKGALLAAALVAAAGGALAQEEEKEQRIPFEGGTLTVTSTDDTDKILAFDGRQLARNYQIVFDRVVEVAGQKVALVSAGDGGNACAPAQVMVFKGSDGKVTSASVGEDDCGAPQPAVSQDAILFVPYLMPGDAALAKSWTPRDGVRVIGNLVYTPEPGTGWKDVDPEKLQYMVDVFRNAAVYDAAKKMLGGKLSEVTTALLVGGEPTTLPSGAFFAKGCVPHACGGSDGFMAVDAKAHRLYFAQRGDTEPKTWPAAKDWPKEISKAMRDAFAGG